MNYLMKNEKEADRLARQSNSNSFDVSQELKNITLKAGSNVLEIGCGAGTLIEYLHNSYDITANGCDLLSEHVNYCKDNRNKKIHFFQHDVLSQNLPGRYDYIFFRYVTHHLGIEKFKSCLNRLKMGLKPGGQVIIIDCDGLMENIGTTNCDLITYLEKIRVGFSGDTRMGRRIPSLLKDGGFPSVQYDVQTVLFKGSERLKEANQWRERIEFGKETYTKILGSETDFARFKKLYFQELDNEYSPFFLNKIITIATL